MIPFSFFADTKLRAFIYKREFQKQCKTLEELAEKVISFMDTIFIKEKINESQEMDRLYLEKSCGFIDFYHHLYPPQLREIYDPPLVLYYLGNPEILSLNYSAIVGTRKASVVSLFSTRKLVDVLRNNFTLSSNESLLENKSLHTTSKHFKDSSEEMQSLGIVSGMALGIDKEAMQTAIDLNLPTLGVLGTPAYVEYPFGNLKLYKQMKAYEKGCLISELLPLDRYAKWTFPMRNRIITGIAQKVYLMETPAKSGAMSSANNALDQNKEIYIFSDPRQENNKGGDDLIADGANSFGLQDLGIQGEIRHITDLEKDLKLNSNKKALSAWDSYSSFIKSSESSQVESLGSGYYFIGNS